MKKSALKNRIKSFYDKHKMAISVVFLSLQLAIGLTIYFLFGRLSPNDRISVPEKDSVAFLVNENPKFSVNFGTVEEPEKQIVRFEAETSRKNPFESEDGNIFSKINGLFQKKERYGIEMSLVGVNLEKTDLEKYGEEVVKVADVIGTDNVKTSTELIDVGREIGKYNDDGPVSKQTVLNKEVANGVDLEYQILTGLGLKEEIIIRDLEAYKESCKDNGCKLPLNEFVFDLNVDEGVEIREGWFTIDGKSTSTYYFVDSKGRYLAHFLPNFAIDNINNKTFDVNLKVEKREDDNYRVKVTIDIDWLFSSERVFPVRIDPSIVHDDTADFSGGIFNRTESVTGPKIQIDLEGYNTGLDCSGGIEIINDRYKIHVFKTSGTLTCNSYGNAEVLVVGGGGGGGANYGNGGNSGGGAGGVVHEESFSISGNIAVTVGAGGAAGSSGSDSVFSSLTAEGGGYGAYSSIGGDGGSGGGGNPGGSGSQGGDGGQSYNSGNYSGGGGGGGAGGNGENSGTAASTANGGDGGIGTSEYSNLLAAAGVGESAPGGFYIAGGGGGGDYGDPADNTSGLGGLGGGGRRGVAGIANTGGGGGGACEYPDSTNYPGKAGGSGVVIVKYFVGPRSSGEYISGSLDMGSSISEATLSWTPSGVNTGNGESPYSTTGLVAQWNLNETSGTTATSGGSCGTSCNGTLINFASTGSQDAAAGTGWTANNKRWGAGALMFDGTNDYVLIPNNVNITLTTGITIETWINPLKYTSANHNYIVDKGSSYSLSLYNGKPSLYLLDAGGWWFPDISNIDLSKWSHVVATYNGTTKAIYVNGIKVAEMTQTGTIGSSVNNMSIGGRYNGTLLFNGVIDSVKLYSRALSANEILSNYQAANIEFQYRVSADNSTWSSWTSYGTSASDLAWESFDNPYLYSSDTTGLVGYWPMEETSGTSVADVAGGNTGTATGTTVIDGPYGKARNFNGSSDYLSVASVSGLSTGNTVFSTEMWIKPTATPTTRQWPLLLGGASAGNFHILYQSDGKIYLGVWGGGQCSVSPIVGSWNYVVLTFDGTTGKCYLDGILKSTAAMTFNLTSTALKIAQAQSGQAYFNGSIDEVRISSSVRTIDEIQTSYFSGTQASKVIHIKGDSVIKVGGNYSKEISVGEQSVDRYTVGLWHLDERGGSGAYLKDSGNRGNHLTPTGTSYSNSGRIGGARNFNGSSDYLSVASVSGLSTGNTVFSIEMWIKPTAIPTIRQWPLLLGGASAGNFNILYNTGGKIVLGVFDGINCKVTPVIGVWNQVAFTFNGTTGRCYLDGILKSTAAMTFNLTSTALKIAQAQSGEAYFNGSLDEIHISSGARTKDEIANAYRLGQYGFVNTIVEERNLSSATTLPIYIAGDRPGLYLDATWGETEYSNYQPDANTIGLWHLDEASGSEAYLLDSSQYKNDGTPTGTTYTANGRIGGATSFNGSSDYLSVASVSGLATGNAVNTVEMWVKPTATPGTRQWPLLLGAASTGNLHWIYTSDGFMYLGAWGGGQCKVSPLVGAWNQVAFAFDGTTGRCYLNGALVSSASVTLNLTSTALKIAQAQNAEAYFNGSIDEVRISNIARTADEIRQAYEVGLRTHRVNIDFGASLVSGNLITGSGDTSFSIDATVYGLTDLGSGIYKDEKIIVKENYNGTEYIAQGTVSAVTESTGAVTVSSWDTGSTFPSGGYTVNADVFKWQREYIPIKNRTVSTHVDAVNLLTFRITNGDEGRNIWVDDLRSTSGYLSVYTGEELTFPSSGRYFQYKAIFNTWDTDVAAYISQVQLDYEIGPTMDQIMRHGKWFNSSGEKQPFWWVNTP